MQVVLLELSASKEPLAWPVAWRGKPSYDGEALGVSEWEIPRDKLLRALRVLGGDDSSDSLAKQLGKPGAHMCAACCVRLHAACC